MSDEPKLSEPVAGWSYPIKSYKDGFQAGLKRGAEIAAEHFALYPESVFPPDSDSRDSQSAGMARIVAKNIEQAILKEAQSSE